MARDHVIFTDLFRVAGQLLGSGELFGTGELRRDSSVVVSWGGLVAEMAKNESGSGGGTDVVGSRDDADIR